MKRVMVTGANGFIGRHSLSMLNEKGYEVHALSSAGGGQKDVHWHQVNLLNPDEVKSVMARVQPSHLLHFAWCTTPGVYWTSPENLDWLKASIDLVQEFKRVKGERVVVAGSCAEYDWQFGYCSEKVTPLLPKTLYGICKNSLYKVLDSYAQLNSLGAAWGRIFFLYGPHEHPARLVASVINHILDGTPAKCTHGEQVRDFLFVEDVASAFVHLLDCEVSGAVNIASGEPLKIKKVVNEIAEIMGHSDLVSLGAVPTPQNDPSLLVADTTRLAHEVNWTPSNNLRDGLHKTVDWWSRKRGMSF